MHAGESWVYKVGPEMLACTTGPAVSKAMLRSIGNSRGAPLKGKPAWQHASSSKPLHTLTLSHEKSIHT